MNKINKTACKTCPFAGTEPLILSEEASKEILSYVIAGTNHLCHSDDTNQTVCRGGRDIFLRMAALRGDIEVPTDAALEKAMIAAGFETGSHINNR